MKRVGWGWGGGLVKAAFSGPNKPRGHALGGVANFAELTI